MTKETKNEIAEQPIEMTCEEAAELVVNDILDSLVEDDFLEKDWEVSYMKKPSRQGELEKRVKKYQKERIPRYQQAADAINAFSLPDESERKLTLRILNKEKDLKEKGLVREFFETECSNEAAECYADKHYAAGIPDCFEEVLEMFPNARSILAQEYEAVLEAHESRNQQFLAPNSLQVSVGFGDLLMARYLGVSEEIQGVMAGYFIHKFILRGQEAFGFSKWDNNEILGASKPLFDMLGVTPENIETVALQVVDNFVQDKYGTNYNMEALANVITRIEDLGFKADWSNLKLDKVVELFTRTGSFSLGLLNEESEWFLQSMNQVMSAAGIEPEAVFDKISFFMKIFPTGADIIIDHFGGEFSEEKKKEMMRPGLEREWERRFEHFDFKSSQEQRQSLKGLAEKYGLPELAAKIKEEGFDRETLRGLSIKWQEEERVRKPQEKKQRLAAAMDLLRIEQDTIVTL